MIKGISVILYVKKKIGEDEFYAPIYEEEKKIVDNVLVVPASQEDVVNQMNLSGKKAVYTLGIPKKDMNDWEDNDVEFFGERFHVFTPVIKGIEDMIPLEWNGKVLVERYE